MNILSVGYPLFPVSADASGGAEQILACLDKELISQGHRSFAVAAAGSHIAGTLIPTSPAPTSSTGGEDRGPAQAEHRQAIEHCLRSDPIDLIHFHGLDFSTYVPQTSLPMLATLHLPIAWYPKSIFELSGVQLNCVSRSQAGALGLPVVANGIDLDFFQPVSQPREHLLWLGRICPEKGVHIALRIAHDLDMRLIVAGPVHPLTAHQQYYAEQVKPLLDDKRIHTGAVGRKDKRTLLSGARCLLVPSLVDETSSLVSMESISCGTPVIALRSGALPEVVEHGVTGFVVNSEDDMRAAVTEVGSLSSARCRSEALRRFDARRMACEYTALHSELMHRAVARV